MTAGPREPVVLTVDSDAAGRLDRYLATALELSRTAAARRIAERCVFVSGAPARPSFVPPRGTEITVVFPGKAPRRMDDSQMRVNIDGLARTKDRWIRFFTNCHFMGTTRRESTTCRQVEHVGRRTRNGD
jgi:hypothetical protein